MNRIEDKWQVKVTCAIELSENLEVIKQHSTNDKIYNKALAAILALSQDDIEEVRMKVRNVQPEDSFLDFALQQLIIDEDKYDYVQEGESKIVMYLKSIKAMAHVSSSLYTRIDDIMTELGKMIKFDNSLNNCNYLGNLKVNDDTRSVIGDRLNELFIEMDKMQPNSIHKSLITLLTERNVHFTFFLKT